MSTTARQCWLKVLRRLGIKNFRATSGLGWPYICHIGDFAGEVPFYGRNHSAAEILLMAAWCRTEDHPVVFDVGANNGFVATQLAQAINNPVARIYAFEPVPSTFAQMKLAIEALKLDEMVLPICCAISDSAGIVSLAYNPHESLFAQVRNDGTNKRVGTNMALAATVTLDEVISSLGIVPTLLKIDVEGFETRVLASGTQLLTGRSAPAVCFEWNPVTASEVAAGTLSVSEMLPGYRLYYIDDFEGQKRPFGEQIDDLRKLDNICNVFGVPSVSNGGRWEMTRDNVRKHVAIGE